MLKPSFRETSAALSTSLLSAKVCKVLHLRLRGAVAPLSVRERHVLEDGARLLEKIVAGSLLVEQRSKSTREIQPSEGGLRPFERALSAARQLKLNGHASFGELFLSYRDVLQAMVVSDAPIPAAQIKSIARFFEKLSDLFYSDLNINAERPAPQANVTAL